MRVTLVAVTALLCATATGCTRKTSDPVEPDTTAPATVADLALSPSSTLTWTAPGDDAATGTATAYDIRYATEPISDSNWSGASPAPSPPAPASAGASESFEIAGLDPSTTYYAALRTRDEAGNWSATSNVAEARTWADTLYLDSFDGTLLPDWDCFDGNPAFSDGLFTVGGGSLTISGENDTNYKICHALPTEALSDYVVEVSVRNEGTVDADVAGLFFRVDPVAGRSYALELAARDAELKAVIWTFDQPFPDSAVATTPFTTDPATTYRLRVDVVDDTIRAFVDGVAYFELVDAEFASGGVGLGVIESVAVFDEIVVRTR